MYGPRGAMMGSGWVTDGYEGSKRPRMMESNPYFAVTGGSSLEASKRPRMPDGEPFFGGLGSSSFYHPYAGSFPEGAASNVMMNFPSVRLRGLPFDCYESDIYSFFVGLNIVDCLLVNKNGRFSGEAYVVFASSVQAELALQRDKHNMGRRYIEVFRCKKEDYYNAVAAEVNSSAFFHNEYFHDTPPPPRPRKPADHKKPAEDKAEKVFTEVLKLRGLPYSVTPQDIISFFGEFDLTEENVRIAFRPDGRPTGDAYVEFSSAEVAKNAMSKDKMMMGSRYVELFPSTQEDAMRAQSKFKQQSGATPAGP